nr:hypothetical protein [Chloroflexota bacterium]
MVTYVHWMCDYDIYFDFYVMDMSRLHPLICLTVITTWTVTHTLGTLSPGTYTVQAEIHADPCWSTRESRTFTVIPAPTPQRIYLQYLPWVASSR